MLRVGTVALTAILLVLTLILFQPVFLEGDLGLCLPSPNQWHIPRFLSWLMGVVLILLAVIVLSSANKKYNFIPEAEPLMVMGLLVLVACNCRTTALLSASTLMLAANAFALYIILSTYEQRNATREYFLVATIPAIGAMTQYSFLILIPVYIFAGLLMKSFRMREFIAFIFGLLAPYWIAIGLGWISPFAFRVPDPDSVFSVQEMSRETFLNVIATGIIILVGIMLSLYNAARLFSRNSRLRSMHVSLNLMGYGAIAAVIFDFNNFMAYFATLCLWLAIQVAALMSFYEIRKPRVALILIAVVFLPIYILSV